MNTKLKKRCLLIGGAGFIGTKLACNLRDNGYDISICDYMEQEKLSTSILDVPYMSLNYFTEELSDEFLSEQDMVVLLISSVAPNSSMQQPESCYGKDIVRMIELLEQMRRCKVNQLVFISSGGTIYGNQDAKAYKEDMETSPINHYGIMKLTQEKILLMYNTLYGMENIIFRLANPYGEGQRTSSGVGAVTAFLDNIINNHKIIIYGKGEVIRDYIYIADAVEMMRRCLDNNGSAVAVPVFNIGTGQGNSLMQIVEAMEAIVGEKAQIEFKSARKIDVKRNVLDISKVLSVIGDYQCRTLTEGIKEYYNIKKGR